MGLRRTAISVVTLVVAAGTVAVGQATVSTKTYYDMLRTTGTTQVVTASSATTPTATPDTYYDM
jgi:hypothetical protein